MIEEKNLKENSDNYNNDIESQENPEEDDKIKKISKKKTDFLKEIKKEEAQGNNVFKFNIFFFLLYLFIFLKKA